MPMNPNQGLLPFTFRLYTDPQFQTNFRESPEKLMDQYKLTSEQKIAVYHAGMSPVFLSQGDLKPVNAIWWGEYALFQAGQGPLPKVESYQDVDRKLADRASMMGVAQLIADELCKHPEYEEAW